MNIYNCHLAQQVRLRKDIFKVIFVLLVIISLCQDDHTANTTSRFFSRYVASVNWAQKS